MSSVFVASILAMFRVNCCSLLFRVRPLAPAPLLHLNAKEPLLEYNRTQHTILGKFSTSV